MERRLGIISSCVREIPEVDALALIQNAGFSSFFSSERATDMQSVTKIRKRADELGLRYEFLHAPFQGVNAMWEDGEASLRFLQGVLDSIDSASENGVPAIVLHVSSGWHPPQINDIGLARYDKIVEYGEKKGVVIAFENLRKLGNHAYLMQRYENSPFVKFCFDNGHEHCYTETVPYLDLFGKKLFCTHIHDNFGRPADKDADGDLHLLPFDGNYDFKKMIRKLDEYGYTGTLMLESGNWNERYTDISPENFLKTAYERAKKLSLL